MHFFLLSVVYEHTVAIDAQHRSATCVSHTKRQNCHRCVIRGPCETVVCHVSIKPLAGRRFKQVQNMAGEGSSLSLCFVAATRDFGTPSFESPNKPRPTYY